MEILLKFNMYAIPFSIDSKAFEIAKQCSLYERKKTILCVIGRLLCTKMIAPMLRYEYFIY